MIDTKLVSAQEEINQLQQLRLSQDGPLLSAYDSIGVSAGC